MAGPFATHPNVAVRELAAGHWSVDDFRAHLRTVGTPLIDAPPAAAQPRAVGDETEVSYVAVTFVRDLTIGDSTGEAAAPAAAGSPADAAVTAGAPSAAGSSSAVPGTVDAPVAESQRPATHVRTLIDRALPARDAFAAIPGTPFHVQTMILPADLRFTYQLEEAQVDGTRLRLADPYGRVSGDPALGGSVAELPDAERLDNGHGRNHGARDRSHRPNGADDPAARLTELTFESRVLGNSRTVWVSVPQGWSASAGPYPFVIVFDGHARHTAPAVRDTLVADGQARPCVVVLVDEAGRRQDELTGNPAFTAALTDELVPWLRREFAVSQHACDVAVSGKSFGGLCAGWTALQAPEVFGNAIMHSPSAWYHPDLALGHGAASTQGVEMKPAPQSPAGVTDRVDQGTPPGLAAVADADPVPLLIEAFSHADRAPIRLYHECGVLEYGPPPAQIWQVDANRWLRDVLQAKGYDTVFHEFRGGHDPAWWNMTWARALRWVFPVGTPASPATAATHSAASGGPATITAVAQSATTASRDTEA